MTNIILSGTWHYQVYSGLSLRNEQQAIDNEQQETSGTILVLKTKNWRSQTCEDIMLIVSNEITIKASVV